MWIVVDQLFIAVRSSNDLKFSCFGPFDLDPVAIVHPRIRVVNIANKEFSIVDGRGLAIRIQERGDLSATFFNNARLNTVARDREKLLRLRWIVDVKFEIRCVPLTRFVIKGHWDFDVVELVFSLRYLDSDRIVIDDNFVAFPS